MESVIVTVNDLKKFSSIGENVDPELLFPHLLIAQQLYLQPVLGDALYSDIISRFDNNWLTGDTQTLYEEYLIPALAFSSWYSAYPFLAYKTQRTGIVTTTADVNTPLTPDEMNLYSSRVSNFKDFYLKRLEDYLIDNSDLFPLFRKSENPQRGGGGIFTGWKSTRIYGSYWDRDRRSH